MWFFAFREFHENDHLQNISTNHHLMQTERLWEIQFSPLHWNTMNFGHFPSRTFFFFYQNNFYRKVEDENLMVVWGAGGGGKVEIKFSFYGKFFAFISHIIWIKIMNCFHFPSQSFSSFKAFTKTKFSTIKIITFLLAWFVTIKKYCSLVQFH